jgi:hypothetical protein
MFSFELLKFRFSQSFSFQRPCSVGKIDEFKSMDLVYVIVVCKTGFVMMMSFLPKLDEQEDNYSFSMASIIVRNI